MADATHNRTAFFRALRDAQGPLTAEQAGGALQFDDLSHHDGWDDPLKELTR